MLIQPVSAEQVWTALARPKRRGCVMLNLFISSQNILFLPPQNLNKLIPPNYTMTIENLNEKIKAYALKNAIAYKGKANSGAVLSGLFNEGLEKSAVKDVMPTIQQIIQEISELSLEEMQKEYDKLEEFTSHRVEREGLPELPDSENGVIMRFSPSPSGPLHLGHAATGMPSSLYVKKYGGKFYLRIEDTNPDNIYEPAYKMIPEQAEWLFGNVYKYYYQSDRIEVYHKFALDLIKKDAAYVCECEAGVFRELAKNKEECPCRNKSVEKNIEDWNKMFDKENGFEEGSAIVRFKTSSEDGGMQNSNPAMRDFPLVRINDTEHPRQGTKYRVWPLMNLSVACDDAEFKLTHIIRAKEHMDNAKRQAMIFKVFDYPLPQTFFLGRYKFTDLEISCSRTKEKIADGKFTGWDDIRLPFIFALKKRGYQAAAFEKMAIERGLSEVDKVISQEDYFQLLSNFNRDLIKDKAIKATFEEDGDLEILMPDSTIKKISSDIDVSKLKDESIVYFEDFGYSAYNESEKRFWFGHK
jgi:glutamyl-tRNA synthetase